MKAIKFLKDSIAETKRLKKPSLKELLNFTYIVCIFCLVVSLVLWSMDSIILIMFKLFLT